MIYESGFFLMKRGNKIKHRDIVVSKTDINLRNWEESLVLANGTGLSLQNRFFFSL